MSMRRSVRKHVKYAIAATIDKGLRFIPRAVFPERFSPGDAQRLKTANFLLVVLDQLGDAIMATQVPEAIKQAYPASRITVLTRPMDEDIFILNPYVDNLITDDAPWWSSRPVRGCIQMGYWIRLIRKLIFLRRQEYDVVIDCRGDLRHLLLFGIAVKPRFLISYSRTGGKRLLSADIPYNEDEQEFKKKLSLLNPLLIYDRGQRPKIWLSDEELSLARQLIEECLGPRSKVALMDPGAKPAYQWPIDRFVEVARTMRQLTGAPVLVSWGPGHALLAEKLAKLAGDGVAKLLRPLTVRQLAAVVACCDVVISADTGIAHVAHAVGTPAITLFGPADPARMWYGVEGGFSMRSPLACKFAHIHENCLRSPKSSPGLCMSGLKTETVVEAIKEWWEKRGSGEWSATRQ
jgi:ADP-heptose:LPS heptosyltransferase